MRISPLLSAGVLFGVLTTVVGASPAQAAWRRFPVAYRPIVRPVYRPIVRPPQPPAVGSSLSVASNPNNNTPFSQKLAASEAMTARQMAAGRIPPMLSTPPYVAAMMRPYAFVANGHLYYRRVTPGGFETGVIPLGPHPPVPQGGDDPNDPSSGD